MSLVDDYVLERKLLENSLKVLNEYLKGRDQNVEFCDPKMLRQSALLSHISSEPLFGPAVLPSGLALLVVVANTVHVRPVVEALLPMSQGRQRSQNQERSAHVFLVEKMVQECHGLDGLTQTHLVGQDDIPSLLPGFDHPVETVELVDSQGSIVFVDWRVGLRVAGSSEFLLRLEIQDDSLEFP
jgi:hypothetical protein